MEKIMTDNPLSVLREQCHTINTIACRITTLANAMTVLGLRSDKKLAGIASDLWDIAKIIDTELGKKSHIDFQLAEQSSANVVNAMLMGVKEGKENTTYETGFLREQRNKT